MKQAANIEVLINGSSYVSIGYFANNNDGVGLYYPKSDDTLAWLKVFEEEEPIVVLWILGSLNSFYRDDEDSFGKIYGPDLHHLFCNHNVLIHSFVSKYFIDEGIILNEDFMDFIFSYIWRPLNWEPQCDSDMVEACIGDSIFFEDGMTIEFINKSHCWDNIYNKVMIKKDMYHTFLFNLEKIIDLFKPNH